MRHLRQWINWRLLPPEPPAVKPRKVPWSVVLNCAIDPHDPAMWLSYEEALAIDPQHIGFVLTANDPYFCIDLDHHWASPGLDVTGVPLPHAWSPMSLDILARFPGAYSEVSYSGDGLHIIAQGVPPEGYKTKNSRYGIEVYSHSRFIAITGTHAQGTPDVDHNLALAVTVPLYLEILSTPGVLDGWTTGPVPDARPIADDDELLRKALGARAGAGVAFGGKASLSDLWHANTPALADAWPSQTDDYDRSAADAALAAHLAFWTGRDCERIARLMQRSALVRDKWKRDDYLPRTILGAASRTSKVYTGGTQPAVAMPAGDGLTMPFDTAMSYDFAHTEEALATRLVQSIGENARYVEPWSKWFVYDGKTWVEDSTLAMYDRARSICREVADIVKVDPQFTEARRQQIVANLRKGNTIAWVEKIARSDRAIVASVDQWDADPWLLNTPAGVVDLRTGAMRAHSPTDHMTKITTVAPGGECPTWHTFLNRVTGGNTELIGYLQRLAGYGLTGSTREHVLPFAHGPGGNGKGVFIGAISGCMGDYHRSTPIETFAASNQDQHPTALASLRGARLVTAQETEEGRRWAESRIKSLTGGDRIAARFMRQDFFEYDPQFTLFIAGNHKPGLRSVDEAIRRRFHLIPFTVTIPKAERDDQLGDKLRAEWPGILAWAIRGALEWQRTGLNPPRVVLSATEAYLDGQDAIGGWMAERVVRGEPEAFATTTELYNSFKMWAIGVGEFVLPRTRFIDALETRGFIAARLHNQRGFISVRIVPGVFPTIT